MKKQKYTLKQIREWFRKLEENRYRKRYMVDAKRVHHYVNLGEDTDLPTSLQRKNGTYTREKALAKQFKKFVREQARLAKEEQAKKIKNESIISSIRKIVKENISKSSRESLLKEYEGIEKSLESQLMDAHIGLGNAQRDILIELTNQGHGDAEKIPNAKKANQQIQKVRQEFTKLCKLVKVTSFKP